MRFQLIGIIALMHDQDGKPSLSAWLETNIHFPGHCRLFPSSSSLFHSLTRCAPASRLVCPTRQTGCQALYSRKIRPEACLRQKFDLPSKFCGLGETNRDPMQAAAAGNLCHGDVCKGNYFFDSSSPDLQMIIAIRHFVGKTMNRRFAKKIRQEPAENAHRTPNWAGVPPQTAVERCRSRYKRDQRSGAQENSALEQSGVPKGDDLHGSVDPHHLAQGLHCPRLIAKL
jgi:hypothetical protein